MIWKGISMSQTKMILWVLLGIVMASVAQAAEPADPDPNRFAKEIQTFKDWDAKNATPAEPVLFVGSSSIRMWRTHEGFPDLPVINRGFGGSHISDVIYFTGQIVLPYEAKVIVFYAGDNDMAGGKSAQRVLNDYRKFVGLVSAKLPQTRFVFITIKPSGRRWELWPEMHKANNLIRDYCQTDNRLFFADLGTPLLGADGKPDNGLFRDDQLHLNPKGYAVWNKTLAPILKQALASSR
jgi:lysophospholipase L1-like esterase